MLGLAVVFLDLGFDEINGDAEYFCHATVGSVLEELKGLVVRGLLSCRQAGILQRGLVHTKLEQFLSTCHTEDRAKDKYLLKPVPSGKGAGILFSDQVGQSEWLSLLQGHAQP
ncbi:hypothetical protein BJY01DRAFT_11898 [Aspergillus pseudoustus]|uniref:Uncharacterized protein n=1 Tax=Aspergillus pseudoustus TaxID=1810923 RepID=A0ABR4KSY0_9EURO